jgi:hypothetical protein
VEEVIDFVRGLDEAISFIYQGVKEHAGLLIALEDMAAEAEMERALRHASHEVSHGMHEMTREIYLIREEQRLLGECFKTPREY